MKRLLILTAMVVLLAALGPPATASAETGDKELCKQGGWQTLTRPDGSGFRNQGDCVSHAARGGTFGVPATCEVIRVQDPSGFTALISVDCVGLLAGSNVDVKDASAPTVYASAVASPTGSAAFSATVSCYVSTVVVATTAAGATLSVLPNGGAPSTTPCAGF